MTANATSRPTLLVTWGTGRQDPDVVTFVAPCPVSADHPAQWTETRDDCRTVVEYWCPVCEVGSHRLSADAGGGSGGLGGEIGIRGGSDDSYAVGTHTATEGDAA